MTASTGLVYFGELPFKAFGISPADYSGTDGQSPDLQWQFRAVMLDAGNPGNFILPASTPTAHYYDSSNNFSFGILINAPKSGEAGQIVIMGETKVLAGASFGAGVALTYAALGFVIAASSTDLIIGVSRYAATAKGDLVTAIVNFLPCAFNA